MTTKGRGLCLAIPGLLDALKECMCVPAALEKILARADAVPCAVDYTAWMFALFGVNNGDLPVAAVTRAADSGVIEPGWWLRADPVYLHADGDSLLLFDNRSLSVNREEAAALVLELQELFQEHGARFSAPHPKRWYLHFTHDPGIKTHALDKVLGKHIHAYLPYAEDVNTARRWRRLLNEIQMRLCASPVNQVRVERGELPINSVWFWGGGAGKGDFENPAVAPGVLCRAGRLNTSDPPATLVHPCTSAARYKKVYADEALAQGLALLSGTPHEPAPPDAKSWLIGAQEPGDDLIVLQPLMLGRNVSAAQMLAELEDQWFAPLLALMKAREIQRFGLWLGAGKLFEATPAGLARWWKRSRNLTACA